MRQLIAICAGVALLVAGAYAPLFHMHTDANEAAVVHAHFPVFEDADAERVVHMEAGHSHSEARSIDFLTAAAAPVIPFDAIVLASNVALQPQIASSGFVTIASPRAHAPPGIQSKTPRAPPA